MGSDPRLHSLISRVRVQSGFKALKEVDTDRARQLFLEGGLDPREVVRYFQTTLTPPLSEAIETGRCMEKPCYNFARFSGGVLRKFRNYCHVSTIFKIADEVGLNRLSKFLFIEILLACICR